MGDGALERSGGPGRRCPRCGGRAVPVVHGLPTAEAERAAARGEIVLGGCAIDGSEASRQCTRCGHAWRHAPAPGRGRADPDEAPPDA